MQVCTYDYVTYLYFFGFRTFTADALQPETCFPYALCGKTVIKVALTLDPSGQVCGGGFHQLIVHLLNTSVLCK